MAIAPELIFQQVGGSVPFEMTLGPNQDLTLASVAAEWDGSGASGTFLACLSVYSQSGVLIGRTFPSQQFASGDSGVVTYGTFLGDDGGGGGDGGGEAAYVNFSELTAITPALGTHVTKWDVQIASTNATDVFSVNASDNIEIAEAGTYVLVFYTSIDQSVVTEAGILHDWSGGIATFLDLRHNIGDNNRDVGANGIWSTSADPLPYELELSLAYTATGAGFGQGLAGQIVKVGA